MTGVDWILSVSHQVFVALGSNLGRRRDNLQAAINALGRHVAVEAISSVYESEPWGVESQPAFLNMCLALRTSQAPERLLQLVKRLEIELGRKPSYTWGPRLIDIDIILFGRRTYQSEALTIPHPRFRERAFVLVPLAELAGREPDPVTGKSVRELAATVDGNTVRRMEGHQSRLKRPKLPAWGVKTYIMGILNVTPDSFSGDGLLQDGYAPEVVATRARQIEKEGADVLDIGGESTRPGSRPVSVAEELGRLLPAIEAIRDEVAIPISVDTYRAEVAREALAMGVDWINDVWGLLMDPDLANVAAEYSAPLVIMHNRSRPKNVEQEERLGGRYDGIHYDDLLGDISAELQASVDLALSRGVGRSQVIIDPGIGFGKSVEQNLTILNRLDRFKSLGFPLLVGPSRKSFIGYALNLPPQSRLEGTAATVALAADRGADMIRVHDVETMVRVAQMTDHISRKAGG